MESYGQRDPAEIIIRKKGSIFNCAEYWQDYKVIHKGNKHTYKIKMAVLPNELKENLLDVEVVIKEIHRSIETGEDIEVTYIMSDPKIIIKEYANCAFDIPVRYTLIIKGTYI